MIKIPGINFEGGGGDGLASIVDEIQLAEQGDLSRLLPNQILDSFGMQLLKLENCTVQL